MKKILTILFFLCLSCNENIEYKKKLIIYTDSTFRDKKDSIFIDDLSQVDQSAFVQVFENNNSAYEQGLLNKGIKVGVWKGKVKINGKIFLSEEKTYSWEGDLRNYKAYDYNNQRVIEDKNYLYDNLVGIQKEFYSTGKLHIQFETDIEGNYINHFIVLSENGQEIFVSDLGNQGTGYIKYYNKDHFLLWEGGFINKKKDGWHYEYIMTDNDRSIEIIKTLYKKGEIIKKL